MQMAFRSRIAYERRQCISPMLLGPKANATAVKDAALSAFIIFFIEPTLLAPDESRPQLRRNDIQDCMKLQAAQNNLSSYLRISSESCGQERREAALQGVVWKGVWRKVKKTAVGKMALMAAAIMLLASVSASGSLAVINSRSTPVVNTATVKIGELKAELREEPAWGGSDGQSIVPGGSLDKTPVITNTGEQNEYIRMTLTGLENYNITFANGYDAYWERAEVGSDEVWYYKFALPADQTTSPLFVGIQLKPNYDGDGSDLNIIVYGEAIQSDFIRDADNNLVTPSLGYIKAFELFDQGLINPDEEEEP
jgi:hypothetical protein